jgi:hypothetical protein
VANCLWNNYYITFIQKSVILPVVLYECETLSLTLREHSLRASENRVLRRIFGPKRSWRARKTA